VTAEKNQEPVLSLFDGSFVFVFVFDLSEIIIPFWLKIMEILVGSLKKKFRKISKS